MNLFLHSLGVLLILTPFVAIFLIGWRGIGLKFTLFAFGITAFIVFVVGLGIYLVNV